MLSTSNETISIPLFSFLEHKNMRSLYFFFFFFSFFGLPFLTLTDRVADSGDDTAVGKAEVYCLQWARICADPFWSFNPRECAWRAITEWEISKHSGREKETRSCTQHPAPSSTESGRSWEKNKLNLGCNELPPGHSGRTRVKMRQREKK